MTLQPGAYRPTKSDRLWLLRAVEGEGAPETWVAQALVNRFMWLRARAMERGTKPPYSTLQAFVRAYAQPVNPRWMEGGDKYEAAWRKSGEHGRQVLHRQHERRLKHVTMTEFSPHVVAAVDRALTAGPVDLPHANTTDYQEANRPTASYHVQHSQHDQGVNTFYGAKAARDWRGYRVGIQPGIAAAHGKGLAGGGLVLALGVVLLAMGSKKS